MLADKNIILGVCGSIAAYKSAILARLLIKQGANLKVIMTKSATHFIAPLTLSTLSKNATYVEYVDKESGEWNNHVALAEWADIMLIAPLSANTLSKLAHGICDNLMVATYLSFTKKVVVAPAMDLAMYQHPTTQDNLKKLASLKHKVLPAQHGELASGLSGQGRMMEPEDIIECLNNLAGSGQLRNQRILITSGPTQEPIDPVRFISNHSSGKMGYELATVLESMGAQVTFISGKVTRYPNCQNVIKVNTAQEMFEKVEQQHPSHHIILFVAAVSDFKPKKISSEKIKKQESFTLDLEKNKDIATYFGTKKKGIHIGFALDTHDEELNAKTKLRQKNLDLIVMNSMNEKEGGFDSSSNKVTFFDRQGKVFTHPLKTKREVAEDIASYIINHLL